MPRQYSTDDRIERICKALIKSGWREVAHNRHVRLRSPDDAITITVSTSPSDGRSALNWLSQLRRSGVDVNSLLLRDGKTAATKVAKHMPALG